LISTGTLLTLDNQIDTTTGTAKLKAVFDNADNALFTNQFVNVRLILSQRQNATVIPTAAIESGTQGDYVFVTNPGPTPAEKIKNQPNAGATGATGSKGKSGSTETAGATGSTGDKAGKHGGSGAPACPATHADSVTVHVDFTLGTSSVLSDGDLNTSQQVVVDGQEKLVDGSNVCTQQARPATGAKGASGPSGPVTPTGSSASTGSTGSTGSKAATPDSQHNKKSNKPNSNTGGPTQ